MKRHNLVGVNFSRIALVDKGASFDTTTGDGAHVLLFKRAEEKSTMTPEDIIKAAAALTPEQKESLKKALGAAPAPEDILKGASPDVRALLQKQAEDLKKANEKAEANEKAVAELQKRNRQVDLRKRVEVYASLSGDKEVLSHILGAVEDGLGEETAKKFEEILKAWDAQIKKGGVTGKPIGSRGTGETATADTAFAEVEKRADAIIQKDAKTDRGSAIAQVFEADPELYARYHAETAGVGATKDESAR